MNFPKYIQLLFLLSLTFFLQAQENNIKYVSPPAWIKTIDFSPEFKTDLDEINNGVLYLLVDEQFNFLEHESYYHFLKKFISNTGIHDHSEYSINYSPIYQEVIFHHLKIYRNDKVIDIRDKVEIKEVDDGNSSSTNIYLGDKAIVLIFKDLRTEDILDISYSINGRNPIYGDIVFKSFLFQFSDPVEKIYKACVVPSDLPLFTKEFNKAPAPIISIYGNAKRYEWEISKIEGIHWPDYVPVWYLPYKYVELSQFSNWNELAQWGLKLYPKLTDPNLLIKVKVAEVQEANSDKQTQALLLIKFVQEEIRYVGLEEGIHAITPHSPNEVISNRYGDCKDKTYLLQALMAQIGIDSKIAWVSTNNKHALENYLPSPSLFDHVILYFNLIGKDYYIDATQNNQADNLDRISFPDVKKALVLDNETYQLDIIPTNEEGKLNVKESIIVESATEPVFFDIKSVYSGRQADVMRDNYSYQGISAFKSNLINFYSSYYPDIVWEQDPTITDDKKLNQITLHEKYKISGFWQEYDDGVEKQNYSTELYAMTIRSYLISPDDKVREMPVSLNYPVEVHQHTQFVFPKKVTFDKIGEEFNSKSLSFSYTKSTIEDNIVDFHYHLKTLNDFVPLDEISNYNKQLDKILIATYDVFIYGYEDSYDITETTGLHPIGLSLFIMSVLIFVFLSKRIYKIDISSLASSAKPLAIGGWLVFPGIALVVSLGSLCYNLIRHDFFNKTVWDMFMNPKSEYFSNQIHIYIIGETVYNAMFVVMIVLLIVLYLKKRTSFPRLYIIFLVVNIIGQVLDNHFYSLFFEFEPEETNEITRNIIQAVIGASIWIPYMLVSKRVKATFIKSINDQNTENVFEEQSNNDRSDILEKIRQGNTDCQEIDPSR